MAPSTNLVRQFARELEYIRVHIHMFIGLVAVDILPLIGGFETALRTLGITIDWKIYEQVACEYGWKALFDYERNISARDILQDASEE